MGGKRAVKEKVRQSLGTGNLEATTKVRIDATYKELTGFSKELKEYQKQQTSHIRSIRGFNRSTKRFLKVTKPRAHEETDGGESRAIDSESRVGDYVDFNKLTMETTDQEERMYFNVQQPVDKWLTNYNVITKSVKSIEQQRLTLDSRRRQHDKQHEQLARLKEEKAADDPKVKKLEDEMRHKDVKLEQAEGEFKEKEKALFADMEHLVGDIQPVQLHIIQFYEFMRNLNEGVIKAFPTAMTAKLGDDNSERVTGGFFQDYSGASVVKGSADGTAASGSVPLQGSQVSSAETPVTGGVGKSATPKGGRTPVASHAAVHAPAPSQA